jgi:hypothetical protein
MNLPNYIIEPGHKGSITDIIPAIDCDLPNDRREIQWQCSYQGHTDYRSIISRGGQLSFRWGKVPWQWSWESGNQRYWNYSSESEFHESINGSWGILHREGNNPVDAETLSAYRELYRPLAVTGYYDYSHRKWCVCEPTKQSIATEICEKSEQFKAITAEFQRRK